MSDETPDENAELNSEALSDLTDHLNKAALKELFGQYHEMYEGMVIGGFTEKQAAGILVELMWRFMQEGTT